MSKQAAERLLKTIDGLYCGIQVTPGRVIESRDVIAVAKFAADETLAQRIAAKIAAAYKGKVKASSILPLIQAELQEPTP